MASTLLENGGVPNTVSSTSLLKEAIHVISCGYEDKSEWGKEVSYLFIYFFFSFILQSYLFLSKLSSAKPGWLDLRLSHRRYLDGVQDALSRVAISILHT